MADDNKLKIDISIPGVSDLGEISKKSIEFGIEAAKVFLNATCRPALEEFGLLLKDSIQNWRLKNILGMLQKAKSKIIFDGRELQINPKIALEIIENCSKEDDTYLQDLWASLFANSLLEDDINDRNYVYVNVLKQLTKGEALLIEYLCKNADKYREDSEGFLIAGDPRVWVGDVKSIMEIDDNSLANFQLTHLQSLGLINADQITVVGYTPEDRLPDFIKVTKACLGLYAKLQTSS